MRNIKTRCGADKGVVGLIGRNLPSVVANGTRIGFQWRGG